MIPGTVIPAKAGIQLMLCWEIWFEWARPRKPWISAFAGMTVPPKAARCFWVNGVKTVRSVFALENWRLVAARIPTLTLALG